MTPFPVAVVDQVSEPQDTSEPTEFLHIALTIASSGAVKVALRLGENASVQLVGLEEGVTVI